MPRPQPRLRNRGQTGEEIESPVTELNEMANPPPLVVVDDPGMAVATAPEPMA